MLIDVSRKLAWHCFTYFQGGIHRAQRVFELSQRAVMKMRKHRDPQKAGTKELGYLDHLRLLAVLRHQLAFDLFLWQRRKHLGPISDTDCWLLHLERLGVPWPLQCSKGENGNDQPNLWGVCSIVSPPPPIIIPIIMVLCGKWILPRSKACFLWNRTIFYFHWKQPGVFFEPCVRSERALNLCSRNSNCFGL